MSSAVSAGLKHILYVEDNPGDVQLVRAAFATHDDVDLHVVENGVQTYEFLARHRQWFDAPRPDLILLDLNLPVISGYEVLRELGADPDWRRLPVVVLSSSDRHHDMEEACRHGALSYLIKPNRWDRFVALADEVVAILDRLSHH